MMVPITAACIAAAASAYGVTQPLLATILKTEGGHVGACTRQANGSHDCGPAQVNAEIWVPHFAHLLHQPVRKIFYELRDDGCFNIDAAAYILRIKLIEAKNNVWDGFGRYNSATPALKHAYQLKLIHSYEKLYPTRSPAPPHPIPFQSASR